MAYTLRTGEMIAVMEISKMPEAYMYRTLLEMIASEMGRLIAAKHGIQFEKATYDLGMVAGPFYPKHEGQQLPDEMKGFDDEEEWS